MKNMLLLFRIILVILIQDFASREVSSTSDKNIDEKWRNFKERYKKNYNDTEEMKRKRNFEKNLDMIERKNLEFSEKNITFRLRMNQFGDRSREEISQQFLFDESKSHTCERHHCNNTESSKPEIDPDDEMTYDESVKDWTAFNWTVHGAVGRVEDQGACSSGWVYSAIESLRSRYFIQRNRHASSCTYTNSGLNCTQVPILSFKFGDICTASSGNKQCVCGYAMNVFLVAWQNNGVPKHDWDPNSTNACRTYSKADFSINSCETLLILEEKNEVKKKLKSDGPMSVSVRVDENFIFAKEGVYQPEKWITEDPNHEVLLVGYGRDNISPYWLVKNSFGEAWGENGYLKIYTNYTIDNKIYSPLYSVSYPILAKMN